jgi:Cu+-exporting ATPase
MSDDHDQEVGAAALDAAAPLQQCDLGIGGMTCASCVARVERALSRVPGVVQAQVNLATEQARVTVRAGDDPAVLLARLQRAVRDAGYEPRAVQADDADEQRAQRELRQEGWWVALGLLLAAPLVLPMVALAWGQHLMLPAWWQFALATPVQFGLGGRFYRAGGQARRHGSGKM